MTRRRVSLAFASSLALLVSIAGVLCALDAGARPGGGHSYSGGGSRGGGHSGGGGGGVEGQLIWLVIQLVFRYPRVGVPVAIVSIGVWVWVGRQRGESWQSSPGPLHQPALEARAVDIDVLRQRDPEFSLVLFEDFVYRLFATAQRARHDARELAGLAPYLAPSVRSALAALSPVGAPFTNVVVGALRVTGVRLPASPAEGAQERVSLLLDANLATVSPRGFAAYFSKQVWIFARRAGTLSKGPAQRQERFGCPNCGAPFRSGDASRCDYCGEVVTGGRFDWQATELRVLAHELQPLLERSTIPERGTEGPTVFHPALRERWASLQQDDPAITWPALEGRLRLIYDALNRSWTSGDLSVARPLLSDGMFDYLDYWVRAYREQGTRNVLERMRIERAVLVKLVRDRHYDAVTVRLWATGLDYTVKLDGSSVVSGSRTRERAYSEYWTLIRGSGIRGAPRQEAVCPNCAAPLKTSMAGVCAYCSQHVTSGEFDFVLSKIEQDDSYAG
ncbi:MAG TPA: TIM44-like domain-containing protein [Polyangiaceae bacterium]|nr:TIM44-like domain-containing protein [Polyangiaceae bacterium]